MNEPYVDFRQIKENVPIETVLAYYHICLRRVGKFPCAVAARCPRTLPGEAKKALARIPLETSGPATRHRVSVPEAGRWEVTCLILWPSWRPVQSARPPSSFRLAFPWPVIRSGTLHRVWRTRDRRRLSRKQQGKMTYGTTNPYRSPSPVSTPRTHTCGSAGSARRRRGTSEWASFRAEDSMAGRIVIPIHDEAGRLVAYAGRSLDGSEPRYRFPKGFVKSAILFNLYRFSSDEVVIVEGFFDCLNVWQAGYQNVVALMGSSLSEAQEKLLSRFKRIILFLDGDAAGRNATKLIADRLVRSHSVRVVHLDAGRQPDQLSSEEIRGLSSVLSIRRHRRRQC